MCIPLQDDWKLLKISHPFDQPRLTTTEEQKRDSLLYRENLIRSFVRIIIYILY